LIVVAVAAFGVAWLSGTRLHIRKGPYIPLLFAVTAGVSAGYVAWLGADVREIVLARWGWGLLVGMVVAAALARPARRQPVDRPVEGRQRSIALGWEGIVYGTAEGVLLSALPAFVAWQLVESAGWSGTSGFVARWTLPVVASTAVIVIHHLGYWNYRNRRLIPVTLALTVQTMGFVITGSWLAPVMTHILLHSVLIIHGAEMPPHDRPVAPPDQTSDLRHAA
jgi:hypothetical protein